MKIVKSKKAFTMLELVMVIVVIGILAALAIPRMKRDIRQEAGDNILSAIRYTQHLALMDDKTNPNDPKWQMTLWHFRIGSYSVGSKTKLFYTLSSNMDHDTNVDKSETAIDPTNGKYMYHLAGDSTTHSDESPNIFIGKKYGVNRATLSNGCNNGAKHIAFDNLGRPYNGIYGATNKFSKIIKKNCEIKFDFEDSDLSPLTIVILKETGYAYIKDQNAS
jgi:prepilin-type N-terminal cleavage/methylation domain-containing protein